MANRKSLVQPAQQILDLGPCQLRCQVVYAKRKTVQLVLKSADLLVIKAPHNLEAGLLDQLIAKRRKWLLKHVADLKAHPYAEKPRFENGSTHFLLGQPHILQLQTATCKRFTRTPNRFLVSIPANAPNAAEELLYKFYAKEAKTFFNARLSTLWPLFCTELNGLYPAENWPVHPSPVITVRRMKSRFGSMSVQNKMSLNTELIRVAPRYIDYVMLHELCHLKHMDHSKAYYALLARFLPNWRALKHDLQRLLPLR